MVCRQLLKTGKDIDLYSTALAPLPGSSAGGSGNCSIILVKEKLKVKVYLFGQTQTTAISLKHVSVSNIGAGTAVRLVLQQVWAAEPAGGYATFWTETATRVSCGR